MQLESVSHILQAEGGMRFGGAALQRSKRRRATSHRRFSGWCRPNRKRLGNHHHDDGMSAADRADQQVGECNDTRDIQRAMNRRMRRAAQHTGAHIDNSQQRDISRPKRLPAHVWLAKRFVMAPQHGWLLPQHMHGKGHRGRSLRSALQSAALLHDESPCLSLQLQAASAQALAAAVSGLLHDLPQGAEQCQAVDCAAGTQSNAGACILSAERKLLDPREQHSARSAHVLDLRVHAALAEAAQAALGQRAAGARTNSMCGRS